MKAVILEKENIEKTINHLVAYGIESFIVFGSVVNKNYYELNGISVLSLNSLKKDSVKEKLLKIKGSLNDCFFLVYSDGIRHFDIDEIIKCHKNSQVCATLVEKENKLCAALLENEIFDYLSDFSNFEIETLKKVAQDGEMLIYK